MKILKKGGKYAKRKDFSKLKYKDYNNLLEQVLEKKIFLALVKT